MKIAVFASGSGSNFENIVNSGIEIALLLVNKECFAIERAKKLNVPYVICKTTEEILETLEEYNIQLIVLAGYMRILKKEIIEKYKNIFNIHPSLLPSFKGKSAIKDAYESGVKITGVTVHFIDENIDEGIILTQQAVDILSTDSLEDLETKIHKIEHEIYPKVIKEYLNKNTK